jgi:hypothetical protein
VLVAFGAFLGLGFLAFTALNIDAYPDPARTDSKTVRFIGISTTPIGGGVGRVIRLPPVRFVRESRRKILQMGSVTDPGVRHEVGGRRRMSLQEGSPALIEHARWR